MKFIGRPTVVALAALLAFSLVLGACSKPAPPGVDTTPDEFVFAAVVDAEPDTLVTSDAVTVAGINAPSPISVTEGATLFIDGEESTAETVTAGQTVAVQVRSSHEFETTVSATVTIGGVSATFDVTTREAGGPTPGEDTEPDAFSFPARTGVEIDTVVTSATIQVTGINAPSPISVTEGAKLFIDGEESTASTVTAGQTVAVQVRSSSEFETTVSATVTIGGVSGTFEVTTRKADEEPTPNTTPDPFSFTPVTGVEPGEFVTSNEITVTGTDAPAPISTTSGSLYIDGSLAAGSDLTVNAGQTVAVKVRASLSYETAVTATVTIGGVSANFSVTTKPFAPDDEPNPFDFTDRTGIEPGATVLSNEITVSGINVPSATTVTGGQLYVNGSLASAPITVVNGDKVAVSVAASNSFNASVTATVTIGGVSGAFSVTTRQVTDDSVFEDAGDAITTLLADAVGPLGNLLAGEAYDVLSGMPSLTAGPQKLGVFVAPAFYVLTYTLDSSSNPTGWALPRGTFEAAAGDSDFTYTAGDGSDPLVLTWYDGPTPVSLTFTWGGTAAATTYPSAPTALSFLPGSPAFPASEAIDVPLSTTIVLTKGTKTLVDLTIKQGLAAPGGLCPATLAEYASLDVGGFFGGMPQGRATFDKLKITRSTSGAMTVDADVKLAAGSNTMRLTANGQLDVPSSRNAACELTFPSGPATGTLDVKAYGPNQSTPTLQAHLDGTVTFAGNDITKPDRYTLSNSTLTVRINGSQVPFALVASNDVLDDIKATTSGQTVPLQTILDFVTVPSL